jgi:hypothetical protein
MPRTKRVLVSSEKEGWSSWEDLKKKRRDQTHYHKCSNCRNRISLEKAQEMGLPRCWETDRIQATGYCRVKQYPISAKPRACIQFISITQLRLGE